MKGLFHTEICCPNGLPVNEFSLSIYLDGRQNFNVASEYICPDACFCNKLKAQHALTPELLISKLHAGGLMLHGYHLK